MSEKVRHGPSDERVEQVVGNLLRIGVLASAFVVCVGGLLPLPPVPSPKFQA